MNAAERIRAYLTARAAFAKEESLQRRAAPGPVIAEEFDSSTGKYVQLREADLEAVLQTLDLLGQLTTRQPSCRLIEHPNEGEPMTNTRPPFNPDPHRKPQQPAVATIQTGPATFTAYSPELRGRPSRATAWTLVGGGGLFLLLGLFFLLTATNIFVGILTGALFTIGATAVIVGAALLSVLGAL